MNLHASYVSVDDFDGLYFQVSFYAEDPDADVDLTAPEGPYLLIQRQFEDEDGGVCYIETHEPDTYAGHFRLHLVELNRTRLMFEIDRPADRTVDRDLGPMPRHRRRNGASPRRWCRPALIGVEGHIKPGDNFDKVFSAELTAVRFGRRGGLRRHLNQGRARPG